MCALRDALAFARNVARGGLSRQSAVSDLRAPLAATVWEGEMPPTPGDLLSFSALGLLSAAPPPQVPLALSTLNPSKITGCAAPVCSALAAQKTLPKERIRVRFPTTPTDRRARCCRHVVVVALVLLSVH